METKIVDSGDSTGNATDWWTRLIGQRRKVICSPGRISRRKENKKWPWPPSGASERVNTALKYRKFWMCAAADDSEKPVTRLNRQNVYGLLDFREIQSK